ncbi:Imm63 family immunity protein [Yinghuangia seranimata]|uniref:Imm63 family immunity protein n=1 Tax=Yinghuangia seranimata TaxID=408067 RepID=UPI00248AE0D7|nr:Imm63 family immunity protein [Yinghuangia seranimata]MDI2128218.1 Imm63 family immunity protein [Yinghuangia seranimata]
MPTTVTVAHLKSEVARLSDRIHLTDLERPRFTASDAAVPYIGVGLKGEFYEAAYERGELVHHRETRDLDELLYWAFEYATRNAASSWILRHPDEGRDYRQRWWERQIALLYTLHPHWAQRMRDELFEFLRDHGDRSEVPPMPTPPLVLELPPPEPPRPQVRLPWRYRALGFVVDALTGRR